MKIEWDDDIDEIGGGFTVIEGELKNPPTGWIEDHPGHWKPQWPPCRYRRLSKMVIRDMPMAIPFCLLPEMRKNVSYVTCAECILHKPPADFIRVEELDSGDGVESITTSINYSGDEVFTTLRTEHPKSTWSPCKYRVVAPKKDCSGCEKLMCTCEKCPLNGRIVFKSNCEDCDFREED